MVLRKPTAKLWAAWVKGWRTNPVLFVEQLFGAVLDQWQKNALMALVTHKKVSLTSAKGCGKSCLASWATWWMLATRSNHQAYLSSVTADNLKSGLWKEVKYWYSRSPDWFQDWWDCGAKRISFKGRPDLHYAECVTWSKDAKEEEQSGSAAGKHAKNTSFVLDEAGACRPSLLATMTAIIESDNWARVMLMGNCNTTAGALYEATKGAQKGMWENFRVTGDPDDPLCSSRVNKEEARKYIDAYGRDHPFVQVNFLAEYPSVGLNQILSVEEFLVSTEREVDEYSQEHLVPHVGIDMSRGGVDSTVIAARRGRYCYPLREVICKDKGLATTRAAEQALLDEIRTRFHDVDEFSVKIFIDCTGGIGTSLYDRLIERGYKVDGVLFNRGADGGKSFKNVRAEMYMRLREFALDSGKLPMDHRLREELAATEYFYNDGSTVQIADKKLVKVAVGRSPDRGDALALSFVDKDELLTAHGGGGFIRARIKCPF